MADQEDVITGLHLSIGASDDELDDELMENEPENLHEGQRERTETTLFRPRRRWWLRQIQTEPRSQPTNNNTEETMEPTADAGDQRVAAAAGGGGGNIINDKTCNVTNGADDGGNGSGESGDDTSLFECSICMEMAKDPVVTCCGHLFCWPCLYLWLHVYSNENECPVCKGEVQDADVIPVYGHGNSSGSEDQTTGKASESGVRIPPRPHGHRFESARQRSDGEISTFEIQQVFRGIGHGSHHMEWHQHHFSAAGSISITTSPPVSSPLRVLTTVALRREGLLGGEYEYPRQNYVDQVSMELQQSAAAAATSVEAETRRRLLQIQQLLRAQAQRAASRTYFPSVINSSAESIVQGYLISRSMRENYSQPPDLARSQPQPSHDHDEPPLYFTQSSSAADDTQSGSETINVGTEIIDSIRSLSDSSGADRPLASDEDRGMNRVTRRRLN